MFNCTRLISISWIRFSRLPRGFRLVTAAGLWTRAKPSVTSPSDYHADVFREPLPSHLVQAVVVHRDVVQLGALLDVLEVSLGGGEGKLVLVHVGDVPQDVVPAALGDHLDDTGAGGARGL